MKRPRWKSLFQNLALSLATFLVCAAVLEGALRLAGYGNLEIYEPDAALYWKLKPNQRCFTKIGRQPVRINSHGTRGAEFATRKAPDTIRILSLGDSRTFGWGLAEAETYSCILEHLLQEHVGPAKKVEVINAGVNAWSFPQMQVYFRDTALKYEPDFVILGEANMWTQFSEKSSPEFAKQFMSRVRLKNLLRRFATYHFVIEVRLKDFYERHRTKFIPVDPMQDALFKDQQQSDPDALFRSAIVDLCREAKSHGLEPVLVFLPTLNELDPPHQGRVFKVKSEISRTGALPLVDLTDDLAVKKNALYLEADPVHLNADGNQIVARRLFESLTNLITR